MSTSYSSVPPKETVVNVETRGTEDKQKLGSRQTRKILILVLVLLLVVVIMIVIAVVASQKLKYKDGDDKDPFTFPDMFNGSLKYKLPYYHWVTGTHILTMIDGQNITVFNADNLTREELIGPSTQELENLSETSGDTRMSISHDLRYLLIQYDRTNILQGYKWGKAKLYDIKTREFLNVPNDPSMQDKHLRSVKWAYKDNDLVFVFEEDLYYQATPRSVPIRLSSTGSMGNVYNYLKVGRNSGLFFGDRFRFVLMQEMNFSMIPHVRYPVYEHPSRIYTKTADFPYRKAGNARPLPRETTYIVDLVNTQPSLKEILPPREFRDREHYLMGVTWASPERALLAWTNRVQNHSIIAICNLRTAVCQKNHEEKRSYGWIDMNQRRYMFINGGSTFVTNTPRHVKDQGRWRNVALFTAPENAEGKITFLTDGAQEVDAILSFDDQRKLIYFISTGGEPLKRHLYRVGTPDSAPKYRQQQCVSCHLEPQCQHVSADFSSDCQYFILTCLGPEIPTRSLWKADGDAYQVSMLQNNSDVAALLDTKKKPKVEFHMVDIGDTNKAWAKFILPPDMDKNKKYPVLFNPYGGPHGRQQANMKFVSSSRPEYYLATAKNVITVKLDGRGTGGRGEAFIQALYRNMGVTEIQDQIAGAKYISEHFPFVDAERFAIWGWSYGGFFTSHVIGDDTDLIKCGIAVAPVTNFRYYSSFYTERFMGLDSPEDNEAGYNATDVLRKVDNFRFKKFMIVHGSADGNVHYQHTAQLMKMLQKKNIQYEEKTYIDLDHGIANRLHLYASITDFLMNRCWAKQ